MAQSNWEADKMLDVYIYDYLLKRNLHNSAKAFMSEGKVASDPVAIDAPGGFLFEWWSVFWDIFIARTNEKHSEVAAAYIEAQQMKAREQQQHQIQMQQLQMMQQRAQLQRREASLSAPMNGLSSEGILGQSTASVLAAKMYEERMKHPHPLDSDSSLHLLDSSRMNLLKAASNHTGSLVQGGSGSVSAALQQIQARTQQNIDIKCDNLGMTQRSIPTDPSMYGQGIMQGKSGLGNAGLNQGVSALTLKGWPLNGMDQLRPSLIQQAQKPFLQAQNQIQLMTPQQQQQLLAQAQAQGSLGNSLNYGDMDPRRLRVLPRGTLNGKDGQPAGNDSSISSPMHSSSPKVRVGSQDQADYLMKNYAPASQMKTTQIQQSSVQTQQDQVQQNNRKRKPPSSSGAANSTGTGNTLGPLSPPSTPSTHTPGDGGSVAGSLPQVNTMSKGLMMYGSEGTGGLVSSSNQLDEIEHFGDVGSLDDNVESFLSHDDGDGRDLFGTLKRSPTDHNAEASKVFTFNEVGCIHTSNGKVVCCHFSSDGKLLASAGHDKKVVLWNMDTLQTESTTEEHSHPITDVRFRPNSTHFATSSFDKTIRLWNAADPRYSLHAFSGHTSNVVSIDFHPKKTDILCSCDSNGEMRIWNVGQYSCSRISEGGNSQVRFHPRMGNLLAAASDNVVSIFDVDSDRKTYTLQGHAKNVHSICWDSTGDLLASVSPDSVRVWSLTSGNCIHELSSNGNTFYSCVFHPTYSPLLVIGGYQSLELWNLLENKSMTIAMAHDGLISALAQSPINGMIASASHDRAVKLWK